jgi:hypothetical protein
VGRQPGRGVWRFFHGGLVLGSLRAWSAAMNDPNKRNPPQEREQQQRQSQKPRQDDLDQADMDLDPDYEDRDNRK